ncbi:nitrous oxide reductase accessory protein NosL [Hydrogenimonas sp.]
MAIRMVLALLMLLSVATASESTWGDTPNKRDPVYQLNVDDYPKFQTEMVLKNGRTIRFASVKAMLHFYFRPYRYPEYGVKERSEIAKMYVRDYLDGKRIDATKAWYVFGSRIVGPHGDDLIPLSSKTRAELYVKRHGGTRIMPFEKLTLGLVRYLDM